MSTEDIEIFEIETKKTMVVHSTKAGRKQEILPPGSTLFAFALPDEIWCLLREKKMSAMIVPAVYAFPNEHHPAVHFEKPGTALFHSDFIVKSPRRALSEGLLSESTPDEVALSEEAIKAAVEQPVARPKM